jgi:hypothetical protein
MGVVMTLVSAAGAAGGEAGTGETPWWLMVGAALLGSSVVSAAVASLLGAVRSAATTRRDGYANSVRVLIARVEYPYRIRRRVSDAPEVLAELVSRGHDLQEELARQRIWVSSENREVSKRFEGALAKIDETAKPAAVEAWSCPPATSPADMNLTGWGPGDPWSDLCELERGISRRFGWRRLLPTWWWSVLFSRAARTCSSSRLSQKPTDTARSR